MSIASVMASINSCKTKIGIIDGKLEKLDLLSAKLSNFDSSSSECITNLGHTKESLKAGLYGGSVDNVSSAVGEVQLNIQNYKARIMASKTSILAAKNNFESEKNDLNEEIRRLERELARLEAEERKYKNNRRR